MERCKEMLKGEFDFVLHTPDIVKKKLNYKNTSEKLLKFKTSYGTLRKFIRRNFTQEDIKTALMLIADNLENRESCSIQYAMPYRKRSISNPFIIASIIGKMKLYRAYKKQFNKIFLFLLITFAFFDRFSFAQSVDELRKDKPKDFDIQQLEKEIMAYQAQLDGIGQQKNSLAKSIKELDITRKKLNADIAVT